MRICFIGSFVVVTLALAVDLPGSATIATQAAAAASAKPGVQALQVAIERVDLFPGMRTRIQVHAIDRFHRRVDSDRAVLSVDNASVVSLAPREVVPALGVGGRTTRELSHAVSVNGPGRAIVRASLDGVAQSLVVNVAAIPTSTKAILVESFEVIEYQPACAADCRQLAYAPLLKLREATGRSRVEVIAVQFDVPTQSTGWCSARNVTLEAGNAAHVNGIDSYLWANDMVFVRPKGSPLPDGAATARVIVRDGSGKTGLVRARAPITRRVSNPKFPTSPFPGASWECTEHSEGEK